MTVGEIKNADSQFFVTYCIYPELAGCRFSQLVLGNKTSSLNSLPRNTEIVRMDTNTPLLNLRTIESGDYDELATLMNLVFDDVGGAWPRMTIMDLIHQFPDGQICIEDCGKIVGAALTIKVDYNRLSLNHTYTDIINEQNVIQHQANGDALYGLDVFVHPDYRGLRLGRRLYDARKELCRNTNLKAILAGGRIPGYRTVAKQLSVIQYIEKVKRKELHDPILSFQLSNDFDVKRLMKHYLPEDAKSCGYATLLEWDNVFYDEVAPSILDTEKTMVRLGIVQWQMRMMVSVDDLIDQAEFFLYHPFLAIKLTLLFFLNFSMRH